MKIRRKALILFGVLLLAMALLCSCGAKEKTEATEAALEKQQDAGEIFVEDTSSGEAVVEESVEQADEAFLDENEQEQTEDKGDQSVIEETLEEVETEETLVIDWDHVTSYESSKTLYSQSNVNVRKGPDTTYDIVGKLFTNDEVEVIGTYKADEWFEIKFQDEVAFVSGKYLGEDQVDLEALKAEQEAAAMAAIEADLQKQKENETSTVQAQGEPTAQPAPAAAPAPYIAQPAGVVFVGDSRCVQMQAAVGGGGSTWICEGGKRVSWMEENAVPRLDNIVGKGTKVVICMGVNDPWHYPEYAALTNTKAAEWNARGATVYFVSVNPVWENPYVTQEQVDTFNANLPGMLNGVRWIDTASTVKQGGYKLVDGLHYDTNAYINIFNLICGSL